MAPALIRTAMAGRPKSDVRESIVIEPLLLIIKVSSVPIEMLGAKALSWPLGWRRGLSTVRVTACTSNAALKSCAAKSAGTQNGRA